MFTQRGTMVWICVLMFAAIAVSLAIGSEDDLSNERKSVHLMRNARSMGSRDGRHWRRITRNGNGNRIFLRATDVEKRKIGGNVVEKVLDKRQAKHRCQSGRIRMDPHSKIGDQRTDTKWVPFTPQFSSPPTVFISIAYIDVIKDHNFRFNSWFDSVTTVGFNMHVSEWADTWIYWVEMSWMACP